MALVSTALTAMALLGGSLMVPPWRRKLEYGLNQKYQNLTPDQSLLVEQRLKGLINQHDYQTKMERFGFNAEESERIFTASLYILSPMDYIRGFQREYVESRDDLKRSLQRRGLQEFDQKLLEQLAVFVPSSQDLVTLSGKEVFTPEIRSTLDLDYGFPEQLIEEAKKIGVSETWIKNFWAGHWRYPSTTQALEMWIRGFIEENQLDTLFQYSNILPKFREPLKKIAYHPLTRVDLRRVYKIGKLTREELHKRYMEIGYNEENAELLCQFADYYADETTTGLSRSSIMTAYKDELITVEELQELLKLLGYKESVVTFWVERALFDQNNALREEEIKFLSSEFETGQMSESSFISSLQSLKLPQRSVDLVVNRAHKSKKSAEKLPSVELLFDWFTTEVISLSELSIELKKHRYSEANTARIVEYKVKENPEQKRRYLPWTTYLKWFMEGIISEQYLDQIGNQIGIAPTDIMLSKLQSDSE